MILNFCQECFLLLGVRTFFRGIKHSPGTCAKAQEKHEFQMCHMNICHLYDPHPTTLATVTAHHTSILAPIEPYSISLVLSVAFVFMAWIMKKCCTDTANILVIISTTIFCVSFLNLLSPQIPHYMNSYGYWH